jgi:integrase
MNLRLTEKSLDRVALPAGKAQLIVWDEEVPGFGVVVGRRLATFIANYRANGAKRRQVIGRRGEIREDGTPWTVTTARLRAREILGRVAGGGDPSLELRKREGGPTLSDAFDLHVSRMRADRASASSIATITRERDKYLANWMNRPLEKIERSHCRELHEQLSKQNGPYLANRVMRHIRAAWNTALKEHDLPANPTIAVHWNKESRRQEPIPWANLPAWLETVNSIEPIVVSGKRIGTRPGIRGDYQMFLLLTGLRRMDGATVRWEHVDLDEGKLHRPNPKGGKERAFNIPLSSECVRILERRRSDNRVVFAQGDGGWVFPTRALKEKACALCTALGQKAHSAGAVVHLIEGKQQRTDKKSGEVKRILPSPHRLRDTYTSALVEVGGISPFVIDVLTNHRPPRGSVTAGYVDLSIEHLAQCQERVTQFLLAKLQPPPTEKVKKTNRKRPQERHLRSLP